MKPNQEKVKTVIEKNTFYFFNERFEEKYEGYLNSLKHTLLLLKNDIESKGFQKNVFEKLLGEKENGLRAVLALTGFSNEYLQRLITLVRVVDDKELDNLVLKDKWCDDKSDEDITEWKENKIVKMVSTNKYFRSGLVNIFFEGATIPFLTRTLPLFELKKLSMSKLKFEIPEMIDTLIRYKEKGSYSGQKANNPETLVEELLANMGIPFEKGDLGELVENAPDAKRRLDFIIPNKKKPLVVAESSYLVTTSSGQGDKSKTEMALNALIKEHYPNAQFVGFVDGVGWYVRRGDLARMVTAYADVFTFRRDEIQRFGDLLSEVFTK